jgi:hypothetical protein
VSKQAGGGGGGGAVQGERERERRRGEGEVNRHNLTFWKSLFIIYIFFFLD